MALNKSIRGAAKTRMKGVLLTLATLVLFILMLAEIVAYVTINISYDTQASQAFASFGVSSFSSLLRSSAGPQLAASLQVALGNYLPANAALIYPINASAASSLASLVNNGMIGGTSYSVMNSITINSITNSLVQQAGREGLTLSLSNQSVGVFQTGPLFLNATYEAFAFVNSSSGSFTFPINASVGVPLATAYVNVTLINSLGTNTPATYEANVPFDPATYGAYEAANLGNIRLYHGSVELYSWCASGCTSGSSSAIAWTQLNFPIPANSNAIIKMAFLPETTGYTNRKADAHWLTTGTAGPAAQPGTSFGSVVKVT